MAAVTVSAVAMGMAACLLMLVDSITTATAVVSARHTCTAVYMCVCGASSPPAARV